MPQNCSKLKNYAFFCLAQMPMLYHDQSFAMLLYRFVQQHAEVLPALTAEGFDKHAILVVSKAGANIKPNHPAGLRKPYLPAKCT